VKILPRGESVSLLILSIIERDNIYGKMGRIIELKLKQNALSISLQIALILIFEVIGNKGGVYCIYKKKVNFE